MTDTGTRHSTASVLVDSLAKARPWWTMYLKKQQPLRLRIFSVNHILFVSQQILSGSEGAQQGVRIAAEAREWARVCSLTPTPTPTHSAPAVAATACAPPPLRPPSPAPATNRTSKPADEASVTGTGVPNQQVSPASEQQQQLQQQDEKEHSGLSTISEVEVEHQHAIQANRAEAEQVEASVLELWPGFAMAVGKEAILRPGDAVYVSAFTFVHMEALPAGADDGSSSGSYESSTTQQQQHAKPRCGVNGGSSSCCSGGRSHTLPGNLMLVCSLWAASPAVAPRSTGALELQSARILERWAKECTGGRRGGLQMLVCCV